MVSFSHSSFYSLGKIIPGWTQRVSLVHVSVDNTEECDIVFKQCVGGKAKKKKTKTKLCISLTCMYSTPRLNEFIMLLDHTP